MLIDFDSVLFKIPTNVDKKLNYLLDGIRYCANSIFLSNYSLKENLKIISHDYTVNNTVNNLLFYSVYKEAWSMIDSTYRLRNFLSPFNFSEDINLTENYNYLLKTKPFRNTFEHMDERIDEINIKYDVSLWGNISWIKCVDKINSDLFIISSGHFQGGGIPRISVPESNLNIGEIGNITIESIQKKAGDHIVSLDLSELYVRTESILQQFTHRLEKQFAQQLTNQNLPPDFIFHLGIS